MARKYDRSGRTAKADVARRAMLDAARALFAAHGVDRVTIAEIADEAGVGASTLYAAFQSKSGLLRALMEDAIFGSRYREALACLEGEQDPAQLVERTAEVARAIWEGEGDALGLVRGASMFAPELREVEEQFEALRFAMQRDRVEQLHAAGRLAPTLTVQDARRVLWALTSRDLYHNLVRVGGWTPARYQQWLAATIRAQLVTSGAEPGTSSRSATRRTHVSPSRSIPEVRMPKHRVLAPPPPPPGRKVTGPASYFVSIETKYGKPIQHWLDVAADLLDGKPHMEAVAVLKEKHGMGHGHANAVVAYVKAKLSGNG